MMDSPHTADIVERLRRGRRPNNTGGFANPDGPEAAAIITELCAALDDALALICRIADSESNEAAAIVPFGRRALAKARGES